MVGVLSLQHNHRLCFSVFNSFLAASRRGAPSLCSLCRRSPRLATVFAVYIVIDVVTFSLKTWTFHPVYFIQDVINWYDFIRTRGGVNRVFFSSALVVHSWLLLFAFGVVVVQLLNYFRSATRGVTWFLKRGREHPLEAVGFVGAMAVFLVAAGIVVIRSLIA
jgi:hypothetical protein